MQGTKASAYSMDVRTITKPREYVFSVIDSPLVEGNITPSLANLQENLGSLSMSSSRSTDKRSSDALESDIVKVNGDEVTFVKFIPDKLQSSVEFEVCLSDGSSKE